MSTTTTYHSLTKPDDTDFADNGPLNTNFDKIDAAMSDIADIKMTGRSTSPGANWKICDGSAISRSTYSELFTAIGTTYGAGDGSTTFNLPDLRGRFPIGVNATYTLAETGGKTSYADTDLPQHTHGMGHTHTMAHDHDIDISDAAGGNNSRVARGTATSTAVTPGPIQGSNSANTGAASATLTGDGPGTAATMTIEPPYLGVNFLIRVL